VTTDLYRRIEALNNSESHRQLTSTLRGIEKEGLRVQSSGHLATTPHPAGLGSPLTNSSITTDFSEALLELVTKPHDSIEAVSRELADLHQFTYSQMGDETIWSLSMPCVVPDDDAIPIANYGTSNVGTMKRVYRIGLGHRYGRAMQTIAGVHYNYSLPASFWNDDRLFGDYPCERADRASIGYMSLTRNFHRYCWLLMYLFGASPAVCESFLGRRDHRLEELSPGTLHLPWATSLRMSDIGYQNSAQDNIVVDLNSVKAYAESLIEATSSSYPPYQDIGVKVDGEYRQLNTNLLQIENEYYAVIRPKRIALTGEKPSRALLDRGVEYVEVRCLDIDPFAMTGVSGETMHFVEAFCLYCLLEDSPPIDESEHQRISRNNLNVVKDGRRPGFELDTGERTRQPLTELALDILERIRPVAALLDEANGQRGFGESVSCQTVKLNDSSQTPSAQVLTEMSERGESFFEFGSRISRQHAKELRDRHFPEQDIERLRAQAAQSIDEQAQVEAADDTDFDTYLAKYFAS